MSVFDILIDSLSDEALAFCIDNLYDYLNFINLKREDVRRVDLKEKLNNHGWVSDDYLGRDYMRKKNKEINSADRVIYGIDSIYDFIMLITLYINSDVMKCGENSRALRYKNKAKSIIAEIINENQPKDIIQLLDDLACIFILLLRRKDEYFKNPTKWEKTNFGNILLTIEDINYISRFFIIERTMPNYYLDMLKDNKNSLYFIKPNTAYEFERDYGLSYNDDDIKAILIFMYIYLGNL